MRTPRPLSELESFVLGLVWQRGPCSAYDLRRHMQASPSTQWSASAGAIYPLLDRLHRRKLLAAQSLRNGKRRRKEYTITAPGLKLLKAWIGPPLPPDAITVTYDPLRSRVRFLSVMSPAEQKAWLDAASESLAEVARRVENWRATFAAGDDPFVTAVSRHGEMDIEWRTQWLQELAKSLNRPRTSTGRS